jgi:hypothetical protein
VVIEHNVNVFGELLKNMKMTPAGRMSAVAELLENPALVEEFE